MSENLYDQWKDVVERTAKYITRDYPDIEAEDITNDLFVFILEKGLVAPNKGGARELLKKHAKEKVRKLRQQHLILSPQYSYRTSDVRRILETAFDRESWVKSSTFNVSDPDGVAAPLPARSEPTYMMDDAITEHSDVRAAWEKLSPEYQKTIFVAFALGEKPERNSAEERRLFRALAKLADYLNSYTPRYLHEGPGSRNLPSNGQARHYISTDYDGPSWE